MESKSTWAYPVKSFSDIYAMKPKDMITVLKNYGKAVADKKLKRVDATVMKSEFDSIGEV